MTRPDGNVVRVEYSVVHSGDATTIDLSMPGQGVSFPLTGIGFDGTTLVFNFPLGNPGVKCRLERGANASYAGVCIHPTAGGAPITMVPPGQDASRTR
jgi:hypothetical protein